MEDQERKDDPFEGIIFGTVSVALSLSSSTAIAGDTQDDYCKKTVACMDCPYLDTNDNNFKIDVYEKICLDKGYDGYYPGPSPRCYFWKKKKFKGQPCD